MSDLNVWSITGRATRDAVFRTLASGKSLLEVGVAINTGYGEYAKTTFATIKKWGDSGKNVSQYIKKGTLIASAGELTLSGWTDKDGRLRTNLELTASSIQLLSSGQQATVAPDKISTPSWQETKDEAEYVF